MTSSSKSGLTVVLIALFVCSLVCANEPNATDTDLVFEISDRAWTFGHKSTVGMLQIKPEYLVELRCLKIPGVHYPIWRDKVGGSEPQRPRKRRRSDRNWNSYKPIIDFSSKKVTNAILGTSAAKFFSTKQRQLCESSYALTSYGVRGQQEPGLRIVLLAVSEEDARSMTMAFLEFLQNEADKELKFWEDEKKRLQKEIPIKQQIIEKSEQKQKALRNEYDELKKHVYYSTTVVALETISEMNKILQTTTIDQASIQAKITAIREFIAKNKSPRRQHPSEQDEIARKSLLQKLEQKLVDETIELISIEAKVSAVSSVLARAKKFVELDKQTKSVDDGVPRYKQELSVLKGGLRKVESVLADPEPRTKPPKVLENKAVIYPVEIKD